MCAATSDALIFSPDEKTICQSFQALEQREGDHSQFIVIGYSEQQLANFDAKQIPHTLYMQYESSSSEDSENIYEKTVPFLKDFTLNYIIYKAKSNAGAAKYLLISWVGTRVKPIVKAKTRLHKDMVLKLFEKTTGIKFSDELNVSPENHQEQINSSYLNIRLFSATPEVVVTVASSFPASAAVANHGATRSEPISNGHATVERRSRTTSMFVHSSTNSGPTPNRRVRTTSMVAFQMSVVLTIDEIGVGSALKKMNSNEICWMVLGYDEAGLLKVSGSGPEQHMVQSARPFLQEDDINYALFKWNMGSELGYGKDTDKILFVVWVGGKINSIRRAKINQHRAKVYDFANKVFQLSGEYEVTNSEELSNENIKNRMLGNKSGIASYPTSSSGEENSAKSTANGETTDQPRTRVRRFTTRGTVCFEKKSLSTAENTIKVFAAEECASELEKLVAIESKSVWVLFSYHGDNKNELKLAATGVKQSDKLLSSDDKLRKECTEENLAFLVIRIYISVQKGTKKIISPQYVLLTYKGPNLNQYFKVVAANHASKLKNTIAPIINTSEEFVSFSDLSELDDFKKLFSRYEVVEDLSSLDSPIVNSSDSPSPFANGAVPFAADLAFEDEQLVQQELKDLQSDNTDTRWVIISYATRRKLKFDCKGNGDIDDFKSKLKSNEIQYVFYKLYIDELGGSAKIVLIASVGTGVKMALKATSTPDRLALFKYAEALCGVSSEFQANELDEINSAAILGKLTGSKGKAKERDGFSDFVPATDSSPSPLKGKPQFGGKNQELKFVDENAIIDALKDLNDDNTLTNWLLFSYDQEGVKLTLDRSGNNGLEELQPYLKRDQSQYALLKLLVEETGYGGSPKIVLIAWVGEEATGMDKAKSSTHRVLLGEFCSKVLVVSAEFPVNLASELNEVGIRSKLTGSKGKVELERGVLVPAAATVTRSRRHKSFGGRDGNLKFADEKSLMADIEALQDNNSNIRWLLFGYTNPEDYYSVSVLHKGSGGVDNFKQYLSNDKINYVLLRMSFMEYYEIIKVILITFVGENSPSFLKSLSAGHRVNLLEFARKHFSIGGEFHPQELDELTDQELLAKITGSKGGDNIEDVKLSSPDSGHKVSRWEYQREIRPNIEVKDRDQFSGEYKEIEFTGKEELARALRELSSRSDVVYQDEATRLDFIKLKITGKNMREVVVDEVGKGALTEEWRSKHLDIDSINIFIIAVSSSEGGNGMITKYVMVQWNGINTKFLQRAQASELRQTLYNFCNTILAISAELQGCTQPEHVTKKLVMEKITGSNVRGKEQKVLRKQEKYATLGKQKSKVTYENEEAIYEALSKLTQPEDAELNWLMVMYKEDTIDVLRLAHKGNGGIEELKQYLKPDNMCFIVLRIMHAFGYQADFADTMSRPYYGLLHWKGHEVTILEKAMTSYHWNHFAKTITRKLQAMQLSVQGSQYHAEYMEEVTLERIKKAMRLD